MRHTFKALLCALAVISFGPQAYAQDAKAETATTETTATSEAHSPVIQVGVNGMVCDFCAQSLKIVFKEQKAVKDVDISLEEKTVTLHLHPGSNLDDAVIAKLIKDSGYDLAEIKRTAKGE